MIPAGWLALASPAPAAPTVTLLEAGNEPRALLRYAPEPGHTEKIAVSSQADTTVVLGGLLPDPPPSRTQRDLSLTLAAAAGTDGEIAVEITFDRLSAQTDPPPPRPPRVPIEALSGSSATLRIDPAGRVIDTDWRVPDALSADARAMLGELEQGLAALVTPFPVEPVGVGARWRVQDLFRAGPFVLVVRTTWTLQAASEDALTLSASTTASDRGSSFDQGGIKGTLEALEVRASAFVTLPRAGLVGSRSGTASTHVEVRGSKGILPFRATADIAQSQSVAP